MFTFELRAVFCDSLQEYCALLFWLDALVCSLNNEMRLLFIVIGTCSVLIMIAPTSKAVRSRFD